MCRHYEEGEKDQREAQRKDDKKKRDKYSTSRPKVCRVFSPPPMQGTMYTVLQCRRLFVREMPCGIQVYMRKRVLALTYTKYRVHVYNNNVAS